MIVHSFRDLYSSHVQVENAQWNAIHQRMQVLEQMVKDLTAELSIYKKDVKPDVTALSIPIGDEQQLAANPEPTTGITKQRIKRPIKESTGQ